MKILELTLFSSDLVNQKHFYHDILGFEILKNRIDSFSVQIGHTTLSFQASSKDHKYHYCFLIPSNQLAASIDWLSQRTDLLLIEEGRVKELHKNWNAESFYFEDGTGNIAEFIVRYDLKNEAKGKFALNQILCVNEMGMPSEDSRLLFEKLHTGSGLPFWKGDLERFGTAGTQNGLLLLVNNLIKKTWFPTETFPEASPFEMIFLWRNKMFSLDYQGGDLSIQNLMQPGVIKV